MPQVLVVSKPLSPPWNDSGKNLARDLVMSGARYRYHIMVPPHTSHLEGPIFAEAVYQPLRAGFSLSYQQKARVLWRLMRGGVDLFHFFFAPNAASSLAAQFASTIRRIPSLQTVCSAPAPGVRVAPWLFGEKVIVLSKDTEQRLLEEGVSRQRVVLIPPGISPLERPSEARLAAVRASLQAGDRPIILFPGDYEVSRAAQTFAEAILRLEGQAPDRPLFVFACRAKTPRAHEEETRLRQILAKQSEAVRFVGEVDDIHALLAVSSVVTLPAESLYAKMDAPLVLLEAMSLGVPIIVADKPPISELLATPCGLAVPAGSGEALAAAILALDPARCAAYGEAGRARVRSFYSSKVMASRYEALYDEILERR